MMRQQTLSYVYRGLLVCLVLIGITLIAGTIYGVFFDNRTAPVQQNNFRASIGGEQVFTGIGRLRISTADSQPGIVIIFPSFVYHPEDRAFSEELALRIREFRNIITEYIGSFSIAELESLSEETIRAEILRRLNAILRLGQIETMFFSDFMIVE